MRLHAWLALFVVLAAGAQAAVPASDLQALSWRFIGPFRGGRVLTVAGLPGDARHFWFGAVDGGVWASEDAGRTWRPIFDGQPAGSIGAIAVAAPGTIYVGTGEADMRSDIAHGNGLYKSTDDGAHWSFIGLADSRQIGRIVVDPRNPDRVFVAALGHAYGPNDERGVFRSDDGGAHWSKVLFLNADTGAIDLAFKPGQPDTIYAALWQTRRPPWSVYPPSSGPSSGLYVSRDGGTTWSHVEGNGFPAHPGRIGIAASPAAPARVYALVDAQGGEGGLYRSDDDGRHWTQVSSDQRITQRGWYFTRLTVDPTDADRVYVMDTVVLSSADGGAHFVALKGDPTGDDFHALWIDPSDPARRILGSDQGAQVTLDGGRTWSSWYNQPTAQIYHVATDNRFPYWVYGAQQDSGAVALPSRSDDHDGITMAQFHEVTAGGESDMIAPDPRNPRIVYGGRVDKLDLDSNQTRNVDPTLAYPALDYRAAWTLPLAFSKAGALYFANQKLFRTSDGGNHWTPISPDLTRADAGIPPTLDPPTAADDDHDGGARGVIYAIAPSPLTPKLLWTGTDDGLVWKSDDDGLHWKNVTPPALTPWSKVAGIEASHFDAGTAYLAVDRHRLDDDTPYLYATHDGGMHWTRSDDGLPRDAFANVVREDPVRRGLLYAGTEKGIFVSFDDGGHWQSLAQNLPMTSVRDIAVHGDDLVVATHGRGFWIMDDVTALRQMTGNERGLVLFRPADAIRLKLPPFTGTPLPKDEPMAANPPEGAYLDYIVPEGFKGPLALAVYDAKNRLVRRFDSSETAPAPDAATLPFAPEWLPKPALLSTAPGMHRFVWNLRYPPHAELANDEWPAQGVWAPPGRYSVALEGGGAAAKAVLVVKKDPRVRVSDAALARAFALAQAVEAKAVAAADATAEAAKLAKALGARLKTTRAKRAAAALAARIEAVAGVGPDADPRSFDRLPKHADSLKALAVDLVRLLAAVEDADAEPSRDARTGFAALSKLLAARLKDWQAVKAKDVAALDAALAAQGEAKLAY